MASKTTYENHDGKTIRTLADFNEFHLTEMARLEAKHKAQDIDVAKEILSQGKENGLCDDGLLDFVAVQFGDDVREAVNETYVIMITVKTTDGGDNLDRLCEAITEKIDYDGLYGAESTTVEDNTWHTPRELERRQAAQYRLRNGNGEAQS